MAEDAKQTYGSATNGIYASGQFVSHWPAAAGGNVVRLYIHFREPSTNATFAPVAVTTKLTNGIEVGQTPFDVAKYFMATNSFCGFIELRNESGNKMPLLNFDANSPKNYPSTYNLKLASRLTEQWFYLPGGLSGTDPELFRLHIQQYFKIEKSGDYQLTVWPKIYKRSETNRNLCERIDLPPVTIPIHWTEALH